MSTSRTAGSEFLELGTSEIAALSDSDFESALARIKQTGLPVPATNLFLPATLKVTGPAVDRDEQDRYVGKAFARLSRLGNQRRSVGQRLPA